MTESSGGRCRRIWSGQNAVADTQVSQQVQPAAEDEALKLRGHQLEGKFEVVIFPSK